MSDSDDPVSSLESNKRKKQQTDSSSESDITVFDKHRKKILETATKLQAAYSNSDSDSGSVEKLIKNKKYHAEKGELGNSDNAFEGLKSLNRKQNKNENIIKKDNEFNENSENDCADDEFNSGSDKSESSDEEKSTQKRKRKQTSDSSLEDKSFTPKKKIHISLLPDTASNDIFSAKQNDLQEQDSFNSAISDDKVKKISPTKQDRSDDCENVSENKECKSGEGNILKTSPLKASISNDSERKKIEKIGSQTKRTCTYKETSDGEEDAQQISCGSERGSSSECEEKMKRENQCDKVDLKSRKLIHSGSNSKEKRQNNMKSKKKQLEQSDSSSESDKSVSKTAVIKGCERDSDVTEKDRSKQQKTKMKTKWEQFDSDSDAEEEGPLSKEIANQGPSSSDSNVGSKNKQLKSKTNLKDKIRDNSDSGSDEELPTMAISKRQQNAETKRGSKNDTDSNSDSAEEIISKRISKKISNSSISGKASTEKKLHSTNTKAEDESEDDSIVDSNSEDEKPLKNVSKKSTKQRDSAGYSGRVNSGKKSSNIKKETKTKSENLSNTDSDSENGKPLKITTKKIKKKDSPSDYNKEFKEQRSRTKIKNGRRKDSDSDYKEEKSTNKQSSKSVNQRDSSSSSNEEDGKSKQQGGKTKIKNKTLSSATDSEEEILLKTVTKKSVGLKSGSNREANKKKETFFKLKTKAEKGKNSSSGSDSEEEMPLISVSKKTVMQRHGSKKEDVKSNHDSSDSDSGQSVLPKRKDKLTLTKNSENDLAKESRSKKSKQSILKQKPKYTSESEDEKPLKVSKLPRKQSHEKLQNKKPLRERFDSETSSEETDTKIVTSSDDDKPLKKSSEKINTNQDSSSKSPQKDKLPTNDEKRGHTMSDSNTESDTPIDNKSLKKKGRKAINSKSVKNVKSKSSKADSTDSSSCEEDKSNNKNTKNKNVQHSMSSSDDSSARTKTRVSKSLTKTAVKSKANESSSSDDSDSNEKSEKTKGKKDTPENKRITSLKRYLRIAGIHHMHHAKALQNCRSNKAKVEALLELLRKEGLKGNPTVQKCKHLRKKIETRREVQELDLGNIIETKGRLQRSTRHSSMEDRSETRKHDTEEQTALMKERFSRIRDIIDSDSD